MDGYFGEIRIFAGTYAPQGWAICDGRLLQIVPNQQLFSIIGTIYGGDGQTNFAIPDLRGRFPVGVGTGPGLNTKTEGDTGGEENVTLNTSQIPAHTHTVNVNAGAGTSGNPTSNYIAGAVDATANAIPSFAAAPTANTLNAGSLNTAGQSQPHQNMPPYLAMNYIICIEGLFPGRN